MIIPSAGTTRNGLVFKVTFRYYDSFAARIGRRDFTVSGAGLLEASAGWQIERILTVGGLRANRVLIIHPNKAGGIIAGTYFPAENRIAVNLTEGKWRRHNINLVNIESLLGRAESPEELISIGEYIEQVNLAKILASTTRSRKGG